MNDTYLRYSMRLPVSYRGTISDGQQTLKCLVQDVSGSGMLIVSNASFKPGQILALDCQTGQGQLLACKVEVRHCDDDMCMGVTIVEIIAQSAGGFQHYVRPASKADSHGAGQLDRKTADDQGQAADSAAATQRVKSLTSACFSTESRAL